MFPSLRAVLDKPDATIADISKVSGVMLAYSEKFQPLIEYFIIHIQDVVNILLNKDESLIGFISAALKSNENPILRQILLNNILHFNKIITSKIYMDINNLERIEMIHSLIETEINYSKEFTTEMYNCKSFFSFLVKNMNQYPIFDFLRNLVKNSNIEYSGFLIQTLINFAPDGLIITDEDKKLFRLDSPSMINIKEKISTCSFYHLFKLSYFFAKAHPKCILFADLICSILVDYQKISNFDKILHEEDVLRYLYKTYNKLEERSRTNYDLFHDSEDNSYNEEDASELNRSYESINTDKSTVLVGPCLTLENAFKKEFYIQIPSYSGIYRLGSSFINPSLKYLTRNGADFYSLDFLHHMARLFILAPFQEKDLDYRASILIPKISTVNLFTKIINIDEILTFDDKKELKRRIRQTITFWEGLNTKSRLSICVAIKFIEWVKDNNNESVYDLPKDNDEKAVWDLIVSKYSTCPYKQIFFQNVPSVEDQKYYDRGQSDYQKLISTT